KYEPIQGEYFSWSVNIRDGVYYANRRNSGYDRKRVSLNTRDWEEALENLKALDRYTALELGLITEDQARDPSDRVSIARGWNLYLEHCDRGQIQGGVSPA